MPDVVRDGETGYLMESDDTSEIGDDISRILDRDDLEKVRTCVRELVEVEYSLSAAVGRFCRILRSVHWRPNLAIEIEGKLECFGLVQEQRTIGKWLTHRGTVINYDRWYRDEYPDEINRGWVGESEYTRCQSLRYLLLSY